MERKIDSLLVGFAVVFFVFAVAIALLSGVNSYINQTSIYKEQCEEKIKQVASHIESLMMSEGKLFLSYQDYVIQNHEKVLIPFDYSGDWQPELTAFQNMFAAKYPGKVFGKDVSFEELDEESKLAFATYYQEYWMSRYDEICDNFGLKYVYYIVPTGEDLHMYYVIEVKGAREKLIVDGKNYVNFCVDIFEPLEEHQKMWEAWNTGKKPTGYDTYDNEYGKTYAYYIPLFADGKKAGVISIDVEIAKVNEAILQNTVREMLGLCAIIVLAFATMLWYIHKRYIHRLSKLQNNVRDYALTKNAKIAENIEREVKGYDEISALSMQVSAMILELDNYMNSLFSAMQEIQTTKEHADAMSELAHTDALTGIGNKTAYDDEIRRIEWEIAEGDAKFGIVMVDLNFLKRINDTYGHEQGNVAIRKLCRLVCRIFENSPAFRIGGDEFAVIIEGNDYDNIEPLIKEFNRELKKINAEPTLEPWERISASIGYALYDAVMDNSAANVFKRADKAMYRRKQEMKAVRVD